jgi:hypothetical protein
VTVTADQIKAEFPEFANTDSALIDYRIEDAMRLVDASAFGDMTDQAVKYLACHMVALMPHGEPARLVESQEASGASTTYERQYLLLKRSAVFAPTVV